MVLDDDILYIFLKKYHERAFRRGYNGEACRNALFEELVLIIDDTEMQKKVREMYEKSRP